MRNLLITLSLFSFACSQENSVQDLTSAEIDVDLCAEQADDIQSSFEELDVQAQEFDGGCLIFASSEPGEEELLFCRADLTHEQLTDEMLRFSLSEDLLFCEGIQSPDLSEEKEQSSRSIPQFDPAIHRPSVSTSKMRKTKSPKPKSINRASNRFKVEVRGVEASPRSTLHKRIISAGKSRLQTKANAQGVVLQSAEVINLSCSKGSHSVCSATVQSKVVR